MVNVCQWSIGNYDVDHNFLFSWENMYALNLKGEKKNIKGSVKVAISSDST